jgi:hypothetical protein
VSHVDAFHQGIIVLKEAVFMPLERFVTHQGYQKTLSKAIGGFVADGLEVDITDYSDEMLHCLTIFSFSAWTNLIA